MKSTYAVSWNGPDGGRCAGRLEIGDDTATLTGAAQGAHARERIAFEDIERLGIERGRLQVLRRVGYALSIGSVDGPGALREVVERLAALAT